MRDHIVVPAPTSGSARSPTIDTAFTDANLRLHDPSEVPTDPVHAQRSATKMYRTTPLRGLWQHASYFHDGSAASPAPPPYGCWCPRSSAIDFLKSGFDTASHSPRQIR